MTKKTKVFIHPYNMGSESARTLAGRLKGKRILTGGRSKYKYRPSHVVINWGSSTRHVADSVPMLNTPEAVGIATNKLSFFNHLKSSSTSIVPFTDSIDEAEKWLEEGYSVCARTVLQGHSAEGLEIIDPNDEKVLDIPSAKLYTKYVPKAREYRVHVFNGKMIDLQRKIRNPEDTRNSDEVDWKIRSYDNGFIFVRDGVKDDCPTEVITEAILVVRQLGLNFGAVDVIWNNKKQKAFVLEVNTSPGLQGTTIDNYVNAFEEFINNGENPEVLTSSKGIHYDHYDTVFRYINTKKVIYTKVRACVGGYDPKVSKSDMEHFCNWSSAQYVLKGYVTTGMLGSYHSRNRSNMTKDDIAKIEQLRQWLKDHYNA